jgi:hypothetical protein
MGKQQAIAILSIVLKRGTLVTGINGLNNAKIIETLFGYMTEDGYANNVNYLRLSNNFPYYHRNVFGLSSTYSINYLDSLGKEQTVKISLFNPPKDTIKRKRIAPPVKRTKSEIKKQQLQNIRSLAVDTTNNTAIITYQAGWYQQYYFRYPQ